MASPRDRDKAHWPEIFRRQGEIEELGRSLRRCEGWRLAEYDRDLGISHYVFRSNCTELQKHLDQLDLMEISFDLPELGAERNLPAFAPEAIRLVHNVSAAASSLADHTMRFLEKQYTEGDDLYKEYTERLESVFLDAGIFHFIAGLRNYISHRKMPTAFFSIAALMPDAKPRVILLGASLLEFDGWRRNARAYIEENGPDIDVGEAVQAYKELVREFYEWLHGRRAELHAEQYEELKRIRAQLRTLAEEQRNLASTKRGVATDATVS